MRNLIFVILLFSLSMVSVDLFAETYRQDFYLRIQWSNLNSRITNVYYLEKAELGYKIDSSSTVYNGYNSIAGDSFIINLSASSNWLETLYVSRQSNPCFSTAVSDNVCDAPGTLCIQGDLVAYYGAFCLDTSTGIWYSVTFPVKIRHETNQYAGNGPSCSYLVYQFYVADVRRIVQSTFWEHVNFCECLACCACRCTCGKWSAANCSGLFADCDCHIECDCGACCSCTCSCGEWSGPTCNGTCEGCGCHCNECDCGACCSCTCTCGKWSGSACDGLCNIRASRHRQCCFL